MTAYLLKVIICSALFLAAYKLLLEKEKMHRFNRFYLLAGLVFPFVIPFLTFTIDTAVVPPVENIFFTGSVLPATDIVQPSSPTTETNSLPSILLTIYVTVTTIFLFRFVVNLKKIITTIATSPSIAYKTSKIILLNQNIVPHSFLNYIFISQDDYKKGNIEPEILLHELTHIHQKHSWDVIFMELLQAFSWFNPLLFFYRRAIQLNHEFLADDAVVTLFNNTTSYQYLLIDKAGRQSSSVLTSRFNYLITKKRLLMLTRTTSSRMALGKTIAVLSLFAFTLFIFSGRTIAQDTIRLVKHEKKQIESTVEGVSQDLLDEYQTITNRSLIDKGIHNGHQVVQLEVTTADRNRLETIFKKMSKEQQARQFLRLAPPFPPLPKIVPTKAQMESWKDSKIYGVWIDDKKINNSTLDNYSPKDFSQVFISKLDERIVKEKKHSYEVDLMTNEFYKKYYDKTIADKRSILVDSSFFKKKTVK